METNYDTLYTLLVAAKLAYPGKPWKISHKEYKGSKICYEKSGAYVFFVHDDSADAYALWKALAMRGVTIGYSGYYAKWYIEPDYLAENLPTHATNIDAMLGAVAALEAMK